MLILESLLVTEAQLILLTLSYCRKRTGVAFPLIFFLSDNLLPPKSQCSLCPMIFSFILWTRLDFEVFLSLTDAP